jgi:hypothetical protein
VNLKLLINIFGDAFEQKKPLKAGSRQVAKKP